MQRGNLSRRGFVRTSLAALGAAGLPTWYARDLLAADEPVPAKKAVAANDKITMGIIGCGSPQSRSLQVVGESQTVKEIQWVGVCDVDAKHLENAKNRMQ